MGLEQLVLLILALRAVVAVLANLDAAFWTGWPGVATDCRLTVKWRQCRLVTGVD